TGDMLQNYGHGGGWVSVIKMMVGIVAFVLSASVVLSAVFSLEFNNAENDMKLIRALVYMIAPPVVIFWHIPRLLIGCIRFVGRFVWHLFLLIHSELRLLCGVDALIGAGVGYFMHSALIGA